MLSNCCNAKIDKYSNNQKYCSYCLMLCKPSNKNYRSLKYLVISTLAIMLWIGVKAPNLAYVVPNLAYLKQDSVILERNSIFNELLREDVLFPEYALKSSIFETSNFTSDLARNYNNIFGITWFRSKNQIAWVEGKNGLKFGVYRNIKDCIADYKIVQKNYAYNCDSHFSDIRNYTEHLTKIK